METQEPNAFQNAKSNKRCCCCFLFSFIFLSFTLISAVVLLILFVVKPKKPIFHLHSLQVDSLNVSFAAKQVSLSCTLTLASQNPNKLGIAYSNSELGILYEDTAVGAVDVPRFYQPPHCMNVTVPMYVSIERFNLSEIVNGSYAEVQVLGVIGVQTHILNIPLPKIKVALPSRALCHVFVSLDCRMGLDYGIGTLIKEAKFINKHKHLVLNDFSHLSQKCTIAPI